MIQRIQSVYLFLAVIMNGTTFFNVVFRRAQADPQAWVGIGFTIFLSLACLLPLVTIFFYKNRATQLVWANGAVIIQTIILGFAVGILISLGGFGAYIWDELLGVGLLAIGFIGVLMGRKKINDDQKLVQSMDRIR